VPGNSFSAQKPPSSLLPRRNLLRKSKFEASLTRARVWESRHWAHFLPCASAICASSRSAQKSMQSLSFHSIVALAVLMIFIYSCSVTTESRGSPASPLQRTKAKTHFVLLLLFRLSRISPTWISASALKERWAVKCTWKIYMRVDSSKRTHTPQFGHRGLFVNIKACCQLVISDQPLCAQKQCEKTMKVACCAAEWGTCTGAIRELSVSLGWSN
jgi:hypothetical protein